MKYTTAAIALSIGSVLAAPAGSVDKPTTKTYQISKFTTHKSDGITTTSVSFHIMGQFGLDVLCGQYGIKGALPPPVFEPNKIYACGPDSDYQQKQFQWSYVSGDAAAGTPGKLSLWQTVSEFQPSLYGTTTFSEPNDCREEWKVEGVSFVKETVCDTPNTAAIDLTSPAQ
ncbi:major allergen alt [Teratosphaeria destructans]|uniref:Major allergen alt n=1 Tax=Teratosphaeria destructans TaxID=418781 RepID=A0A9W7VZQ0_9PEZI|nr:major allergen alt [Teratosphaeria destructans]